MSVERLFHGIFQSPRTAAGLVNSGGTVEFKAAGTSNDKDTFSDYARSSANANPVVLDSKGRATIYLESGAYDVTIKDADGNTLETMSNVVSAAETVNQNSVNLIPNGSFEEGDGTNPNNWVITEYTNGDVSWATDDQADGKYSIKFVSTGSGGGYITSPLIPVASERTYKSSFVYKSTVADVQNDYEVLFFDANEDQLTGSASSTSLYSNATSNTTTWAVVSGTFTPPALGTYAKVRFTGCNSSNATSGTTYVDNIRMNVNQEQASPLTTKGDVWVYSTADSRLPTGSNGQVIIADDGATTGLRWVNGAGGTIVTKDSDCSISSTISSNTVLRIMVDMSFTSSASVSTVTVTLPHPSAYAGKQIVVQGLDVWSGGKFIVQRTAANSATSTDSFVAEEFFTGNEVGDYFAVTSDGTNEYILAEVASFRGEVYASADDIISPSATETIFDESITVSTDIGDLFDSINGRIYASFTSVATVLVRVDKDGGATGQPYYIQKSGTTIDSNRETEYVFLDAGEYINIATIATSGTATVQGSGALDSSYLKWGMVRVRPTTKY